MRIERESNGRTSESVGLAAQLGDQGGMPAMDAVEVAYANRAAPAVAGECRIPVDCVNRHLPIHSLVPDPLHLLYLFAIIGKVCGPAGRSLSAQAERGKSGLHRTRWWLTATV